MVIKPRAVPVLLAGMWPAMDGQPETGTSVSIVEKEGGPILIQGYSDIAGEFHGRLDASWVGQKVFVVVLELGFKYDYFNPVRVERWGLFLAVRQEKDPAYSGTEGSKNTDPQRWAKWNSTQEHINASQRVHVAVRRAKLAWPIERLGLLLTVLTGIVGFFVHPAVGFTAGILMFLGIELVANRLLLHGY